MYVRSKNASSALTNFEQLEIIIFLKRLLSVSDIERKDNRVDLFIKLINDQTSNIINNEYLEEIYPDFQSTMYFCLSRINSGFQQESFSRMLNLFVYFSKFGGIEYSILKTCKDLNDPTFLKKNKKFMNKTNYVTI